MSTANHTYSLVSSKSTLNIIWLHGLGGHGQKVFKKMGFEKLASELGNKVSWYFPSAKAIYTPWRNSGLKNSWFTLDKITTKTNQQEVKNQIEIVAEDLKVFLECLHSNSKHKSRSIIGGASQGGAIAWTTAEKMDTTHHPLADKLTFLLANTWLPISSETQKSTSTNTTNLHIIYNKYDDIVTPRLVEESIKNSRNNVSFIKKLENNTSKHSVLTRDHLEFVQSFIIDKL